MSLRHIIPDVVHDQDLLVLGPSDTVRLAAKRMLERRVRSVLVTGPDGLAGIFTGTDLIERVVAADRDPDATSLGEVMTESPATVRPDMLAIEALRIMQERGFRHLPVVDGDRLVGVVSRRDFQRDEELEIEQEGRLWERL